MTISKLLAGAMGGDIIVEVLNSLAKNLPYRTYPMMMYGKNNQGDTHIMSLMRSYGSAIFDEAGNFDFESGETVQALEWIQEGVSKGWYPPHPGNLANSVHVVDFMNNSPNWQGNDTSVRTNIHDMLSGTTKCMECCKLTITPTKLCGF